MLIGFIGLRPEKGGICVHWCIALDLVKKAPSHANKKTVMLICFIGLRPEKGGILPECDLEHKWAVNREPKNSEEVKK